MIKQGILIGTILVTAIVILFVSITQSAQVRYSFNGNTSNSTREIVMKDGAIEYYFPYPGRILPDHPLWSIKAARDQAWLFITPKSERKAELNLLFANKRLVSSKILFEKNKPELAYSTLVKAESYLQDSYSEEKIARENGVDTKSFLYNLSLASLKHREIINEMINIAPEDAGPQIVKMEDVAKRIYNETAAVLTEIQMDVPESPFSD